MSKILLCQLGTAPIILREAFEIAPEQFKEVHAISTNNTKSDYTQLMEYFADFPEVQFTLTIIEEIALIKSAEDYQTYQEYLWRWYIEKSEGHLPYVCLSGGTKSMVALMHQATTIFGATEAFLVQISPPEPKTLAELLPRIQEIDFITLGYQHGWQAIKNLKPSSFPLNYQPISATTFLCTKAHDSVSLKSTVDKILAKIFSQNSSTNPYPFNNLNLLPEEILQWLQQPLNWNDLPWLQQLPKLELHCHLGGFATFGPLLDEVRNADSEQQHWPETIPKPNPWPLATSCVNLDTYMQLGNNSGSSLFKNRKRLRKQIELLYEHLVAEKVVYAEIRCSPNNYAQGDRSAWEVLWDIQETFQRLMDNDGRCHVNLIVIATRKSDGDFSPISKHLALAITASQRIISEDKCRVVGVDLAGFENEKTRASYFIQDFTGVLRCGLAITAHAGENDSAEGIWQAVHSLHARRLGHALNLQDAPDLLQTVADRKIAIEMCPYANYQIKGFHPMLTPEGSSYPAYPLLQYLEKGLLVTVNTDNIGISDASLSQNFQLLSLLCTGISRMQVLQLIRNSLDAAFITPTFRSHLLKKIEKELFNTLLTSSHEKIIIS